MWKIAKKYLVLLILAFFAIKAVQIINSSFLNSLFSTSEGLFTLGAGVIFVLAIFLLGVFVKKRTGNNKRILNSIWVPLVLFLIAAAMISPQLFVIFLAGIFFYGFSYAEGRLMEMLERKFGLYRALSLIISIGIYAVSYATGLYFGLVSVAIFMAQSLLAFMVSYTIRTEKQAAAGGGPPAFIGILFMAISAAFYYVGKAASSIEIPPILVPFSLLFYAAGAMIVYMSLTNYLEKKV